ncbi:hypothetical protein ACSBOB_16315 [Mesorhizobium sp. ASY16-5R]|uniref:hypothetical protein n=1 Tax=Mesorhizobium sp. ASY16-5R TaxID=3445772 RepID=UPI003F9FD356
MALLLCALGVAIIYLAVYRFSKLFGVSNNTTVLVDTVYESIKERRFKVPVRDLAVSSFRNVLYGWAVVAILMGCVLLALLILFILQQAGIA